MSNGQEKEMSSLVNATKAFAFTKAFTKLAITDGKYDEPQQQEKCSTKEHDSDNLDDATRSGGSGWDNPTGWGKPTLVDHNAPIKGVVNATDAQKDQEEQKKQKDKKNRKTKENKKNRETKNAKDSQSLFVLLDLSDQEEQKDKKNRKTKESKKNREIKNPKDAQKNQEQKQKKHKKNRKTKENKKNRKIKESKEKKNESKEEPATNGQQGPYTSFTSPLSTGPRPRNVSGFANTASTSPSQSWTRYRSGCGPAGTRSCNNSDHYSITIDSHAPEYNRRSPPSNPVLRTAQAQYPIIYYDEPDGESYSGPFFYYGTQDNTPVYHSTFNRATGPGYSDDGLSYCAAGSGRVYNLADDPPGKCFNCGGNHWRKDCGR